MEIQLKGQWRLPRQPPCRYAKKPETKIKQTNRTKTNKQTNLTLQTWLLQQKRVNLEMQLVPGCVLHTEEIYIQQLQYQG